jgi:hypothetical protein
VREHVCGLIRKRDFAILSGGGGPAIRHDIENDADRSDHRTYPEAGATP